MVHRTTLAETSAAIRSVAKGFGTEDSGEGMVHSDLIDLSNSGYNKITHDIAAIVEIRHIINGAS